jgi:hypothetical protein
MKLPTCGHSTRVGSLVQLNVKYDCPDANLAIGESPNPRAFSNFTRFPRGDFMAHKAVASVLKVSVERKETLAIIRLRGKLLAAMGGRLYSTVCPLIPELKRIVMDL